jgi:CheY-like chemotaxis protein
MAIFGFGKDKKDGGGSSELVLAYLEDAQRVRAPFTLVGPRKTEVAATLQGMDEAEGTATFQLTGPLMADKGQTIEFIFIQESLRIGGSARLLENRPGVAILELPDALELKERRGAPRARVNSKEGATLTALTGLFEGVGITGAIENVSESGLRVRVDKAMSIKGEKRLPLGTGLVPVGQPFMLLKLNKIPKCPAVLELEGSAAYLDFNASGLAMGIKFSKPKSDVTSALKGMVSSRSSTAPSSLPAKARRKTEAQSANLLADEPLVPAQRSLPKAAEPAKAPEPAKPEAKPPEAKAPDVKAAAPAPELPPQADPPADEEALASNPKSDSLMRLKKRSRAVVALSRTAAFNDILKSFLQEDGFGRILTTTFPEEVFDLLRQPNLGVLLLDGNMSVVESLEFVQRLRTAFHDLPPIVLAAEDISTTIVLAARRNGVAQLVVRPYALDSAFSGLLAEQIALK